MGIYYFDSSAIVKRYVIEPGTPWVRNLCTASEVNGASRLHSVYLGEITRVEVAAALFQKARRSKQINLEAANDAYKLFLDHLNAEYRVMQLTSPLLQTAAELTQRQILRAYDAVQLALALHVDSLLKRNRMDLIFVSSDEDLLQAAQAEKLATDNPLSHAE